MLPKLARAAWIVPAFGVVAVTWSVIAPIETSSQRPHAVSKSPRTPSRPYPADSLGHLVTARDLFRTGRRPALIMYDPVRAAQPVVEAPPKPTLVLVGIVVGMEPTAIIEGFPGIEGSRVVRIGDVVAGLRVRSIASTGVRVTGMDTLWILKVREPWHN
jgi:hypothetical protein